MRKHKKYYGILNLSACRKLVSILIFLSLVVACASSPTPSPAVPTSTVIPVTATLELPDSILFIGNSLTYRNLGVNAHIKELAASANPSLIIETSSIVIGGATLEQLWDDSKAINGIQEGVWDVVVLQEIPQVVANDEQEYEKFYEYVRKFNQEIKQVGAKTVLYMTWERDVKNPTVTTDEIAQVHRRIGAELGIKVAPVGLAWQRSIQERPDLKLYDPDMLHPSARGTYLATCVLYATIFAKSPVGLDYQPADMIAGIESMEWKREQWQMTDDEIAFLQRIAWDTVIAYQAQE